MIPFKYIGIFLALFVASVHAADDAPVTEVPLIDGVSTDVPGAIADTSVNRLMEQKAKTSTLRPNLGFEDIFLVKGSSSVLDIHKLGVANPAEDLEWMQTSVGIIAKAEKDASGGQRIFAGQTSGTTEVLVYEKKPAVAGRRERGDLLKVYKVTVTSDDLLSLLQEVKALIGDVEGIEIRVVGTQIVVDGAILIPKDMRRVTAVIGKYQTEKKPIINLAEISPLSMKLLGEKMEEEIAGGKDRPKDIKVKVVNGRFFLEGAVDKLADRQTAEKICGAYIADRYVLDSGGKVESPKVKDLGECVTLVKIRQGQPQDPDPIISVRIDFVTLNKNYARSFDFHWEPGADLSGSNVGYSSDIGKFTASFTGLVTSLFPKLQTATDHGYARILKSATLLVRDGENSSRQGGVPPEASITENLKIPVTVAGTANTPPSFTTADVKTFIKVLAKSVGGSDKVNMDIVAQQSELQSSTNAAGPTILDNTIQTSIVIANGESAALGGLITERRNVDVARTPASQANNNSFSLFYIGKSNSLTDTKGQFIVFVTPEKIRSPSEGTEKLKRKFRLRK